MGEGRGSLGFIAGAGWGGGGGPGRRAGGVCGRSRGLFGGAGAELGRMRGRRAAGAAVAGRGAWMTAGARLTEEKMRVSGVNIEVTGPIREYVQEKVGRVLGRYERLVTRADVRLVVAHNPSIADKHTAEVVAAVSTRQLVRAEVRSDSMYASIDLVAAKLGRTLRKFKERLTGRKRGASKTAEDIAGAPAAAAPEELDDEEQQAMEDDRRYAREGLADAGQLPRSNEIVKRKVFPMPRQTVEEAVLCLEYIDHDFYLFREAESGEINLVYKRNHGGVGLITPEDPNATEDE